MESNEERDEVDPYAEVRAFLAPVESEIRVYVGKDLIGSWFSGADSISDELRNELNEFRRRYYRKFGVWLPGVRFRDGTDEEPAIPAKSVRIEILDERPGEGGPEPVTLDRANTVAQFVEELESAVEPYRGYWHTAESVNRLLEGLPEGLRTWLKKTYSVTDLKILLRGILAPEEGSASTTARYPDWLLASLVGWANLGDPLNARQMRDHLLDTQAARLGGGPLADVANAEVDEGVRALKEDRIDMAAKSFQQARKADPSAASKAFLKAWAKAFPQAWVAFFEVKHPDVNRVTLSVAESLDLEDVLAAPATALSPEARWRVLLYSLAARDGEKRLVLDPVERRRRMRELLEARVPADSRSPANARWLALEFLRDYDASRDDPAHFNAAAGLLESAFKRLDAKQRLSAFNELKAIAWNAGAYKRLWGLAAKLASEAPPDVLSSVQLEFAFTLCSRERKADAERALNLVAEYQKLLDRAPTSEVSDVERAWKQRWIRYLQACAYDSLSQIGEPRVAKAERLYREALGPSGGNHDVIAKDASIGLISLLQSQGRAEEAGALLPDARRDWPDESIFQNQALISAFARGDSEAVELLAREALAKADELEKKKSPDTTGWLKSATFGFLTTRMEGWEEVAKRFASASNAEQREDILLHIAANRAEVEPARGVALFQELWKKADPASWDQRLLEGDTRVLYEMMVGRWIERPESEGLLDLLDSEIAWRKSPLHNLSSPRHEQCSEAWLLEARRAAAAGDTKHRIECLRRSVQTHATSTWEYWEAVFLLAREHAR